MMTKEQAIEFIQQIREERPFIGVADKAASWKIAYTLMTPEDWKTIGYVSALATAFDIEDMEAVL